MFAHCSDPVWQGDDLSLCFRVDFLQILFPLIACGLSFLVLLLQVYRRKIGNKNSSKFKRLSFNQDYPSESDSPIDPWRSENLNDDTSAEDSDSVADLSLQKTISHVSVRERDKPKGEVLLVALEVVILLGQVGISAAQPTLGKAQFSVMVGPREVSIASVAIWGYILLLATLRLCFSALRKPASHIHLWNHTAYLYGIQWLLGLFVFRSAIIHPGDHSARDLTIAHFALTTLLCVIALFSRRGNKSVVLEYEKDLEPSHEPLASVISLASFAWVDAIVWRGYQKTLELGDVWNINIEDKAALVLSHFRQIRKTHSLAVRLLWFFKTKLLVQGAWAVLGGVCLFLPTLLLKLILEYLEDPYSTPANAAWLYVILLFFNGTIMAVANGQGLWIGRKISLQLRAVIVGEIYSKALRRKAAARAENDLRKESENKGKQSFIRRLLFCGRRKQAPPDSSTNQSQRTPIDDTAKAEKPIDVRANNGKIINLMSIDSFKVADICAYLHFLWAATPVQIVMAITLLYRILGFSSFAGIAMMGLLLPLNLYIAKSFSRTQKTIMAATDARIHSTNEVLQNIRIIKYFAWERRFAANVNDKRRVELRALRKRYILWSLAATIWSAVPILITFVSFFIYTVIEHKPLLPSVAFPALSTFALLRIPLDQLADMVAHVQDSKVSVDRIDQFLNEEDTEKYLQLQKSKKLSNGETRIALEDATLTWGSKKDSSGIDSLDSFRLINITAEFHVGRLNIIAGPTGSGKTSLMMALLGEMTLLKGNVLIPGGSIRQELRPDRLTGLTESVAYCAQQAWLVNDTIKENILFASPFDPERYRAVIAACALERDLEILDAGDKTLVGEKGIALSGGQKQRISLARALYCNSKHVFLDDCLSAVDSHTAKHIFEGAIMGTLMLNRTCILVTHNVTLTVPQSSYVVVLDKGKISAQGVPEEVIKSGVLGDELLKSLPASRGQSVAPSRVASNLEEQIARRSKIPDSANGHAEGGVQKYVKQDKNVVDTRIENKAVGSVKMTTITMYLRSMGPWYFWVFAAFGFVATQVGSVATNVWIRQWANAYRSSELYLLAVTGSSDSGVTTLNNTALLPTSLLSQWHHTLMNSVVRPSQSGLLVGSFGAINPMGYWQMFGVGPVLPSRFKAMAAQHGLTGVLSNATLPDVDVGYYLGIYALIGLAYVLICLSRELILFWGSLHASWKIHESLLNAILRAQFKFFDSTPLGQLMNRFSKDIQSVDQEVSPVAIGMIHSLASVITVIILISVITPGFLIAGVFIGLIYFATAFFYIHSSRDLKRIESVQRSPLFQAFGETLSGVVTIRAYGDESRFLQENHNRVNTHNRPFIFLWATNRWLAFRIDIAGALVSFFTGVFVIMNVGRIDAGAAGLSLSYAITFTENVLWLVRLYAANEQNMNAVERVKEYIDVEQEAPAEIPETKPAVNWPSHGAVQFIGYSTRYRKDLNFVLRNVSFLVRAGEKVGIVGRTGAGKSSLALALFRGLEAEEGKILIDDVDIGLIGLQDLREAITIVPQDPTLFTGTLRSNLDPFGIFTDEEIFTALRRVQLISSAAKAENDATDDKHSRLAATHDVGQSHAKDLHDTPTQSGAATPDSSHAPTLTASSTPFHAGDGPEGGADGLGTDLVESPTVSGTQSSETTLTKATSNARDENKNIFLNLSSAIAESGSNLSQGQRQLLCLARALLKSPRVLLMDEATASIDYATDSKIQETLRELKDNTIITIAHRLQTIIDYDKVLVLDKGEVVEYADPWELIQREDGAFRGMCKMSGDFDTLMDLARKARESRRLIDDT